MKLEVQLMKLWNTLHSNGSVLVEGFEETDYKLVLSNLLEHSDKNNEALALSFRIMMSQNPDFIREQISRPTRLLVYDMDLFGQGTDPKKATDAMVTLRTRLSETESQRQLMLAGPGSDLNYNSRQDYIKEFPNFPLFNWCSFYEVKDGKLVQGNSPRVPVDSLNVGYIVTKCYHKFLHEIAQYNALADADIWKIPEKDRQMLIALVSAEILNQYYILLPLAPTIEGTEQAIPFGELMKEMDKVHKSFRGEILSMSTKETVKTMDSIIMNYKKLHDMYSPKTK